MHSNAPATTLTPACAKPTSAELELENSRLQRLVADLLVTNQQLRVELKALQRAPSYASNPGPHHRIGQ
jgi:hypothetical protein